MSTFNTWIDTYFAEKGTDLERHFETQPNGTCHIMPYAAVVATAKRASKKEQALIKKTLVIIDFKNGDPCHYLRHLGECLARETDKVMGDAA